MEPIPVHGVMSFWTACGFVGLGAVLLLALSIVEFKLTLKRENSKNKLK